MAANGQVNPLGAEHYKLPEGVKMILDATIQQAAAFSVVLALFGGALTSLAQNVGNNFDSDDSPASWKALRIFLYSAIMLNLSGACLSLMIVKMCTDLSLTAYQKPTPGPCTLVTVTRLLRDYNMSHSYWLVNQSFTFVSVLACLSTFATVSFWVFLSETFTIAWVTMIISGLLAINIILVAGVTVRGQGWT